MPLQTDLKNTTSYDGDAIQAGINIGSTNNKPQASMNGIGYGTDSDSDSSITKGGVSGYNDKEGIFTTDNREILAGKLDDVFDAETVNEELGAQTEITQAFDQERRKIKTEINAKEKKHKQRVMLEIIKLHNRSLMRLISLSIKAYYLMVYQVLFMDRIVVGLRVTLPKHLVQHCRSKSDSIIKIWRLIKTTNLLMDSKQVIF